MHFNKYILGAAQFYVKSMRRKHLGDSYDALKRLWQELLAYWAVHELGFTMTELAQKLKISQPAVSIVVQRGARIAEKNGYSLVTE